MTREDIALSLFTLFSAVRVLGYFPQIVCTLRDTSGGASTSISAWTMFLAGHLSVVPYAILNMKDVLMAAAFGANALCCAVVILGTLWKRRRTLRGCSFEQVKRDRPGAAHMKAQTAELHL